MFQVGDRVVCVDAASRSAFPEHLRLLRKGSVYRIAGFTTSGGFILAGLPKNRSGGGYKAARFRKIQPCEPEFIDLLKRIKPKVDA